MQPQYSFYPQVFAPVLEYVGVGRRFVALIIDGIILGIFQALLLRGMNIMGLHSSGNTTTTEGDAAHMLAYWLRHLDTYGVLQIGVTTIIPFVYFIICEASQGATIGKMALGMRVVRLDGSPISWGQSFSRNLLRLIDHIPYGIPYLLGAILIWASPTRQRLGDRVAQTVVVRRRSLRQ
jgi:uncharacterized RDD family membrane protein YckC